MADGNGSSSSTSSASSAKGSSMGFLGKKLGPLPVWLWGVIGFGAYYWYTHYGPGAKQQQQQGQGQQRQARGRGRGGGTRVIIVRDGGGGGHHRRSKGKASPRAGTTGANVGGGAAAASPAAVPPQPDMALGGPVDAATGQPVYAQYQAYYGGAAGGDGAQAPTGVPEPVMAYAPQTAGAIYG